MKLRASIIVSMCTITEHHPKHLYSVSYVCEFTRKYVLLYVEVRGSPPRFVIIWIFGFL